MSERPYFPQTIPFLPRCLCGAKRVGIAESIAYYACRSWYRYDTRTGRFRVRRTQVCIEQQKEQERT